jgi:hypothetical protein
MKKGTRVSFSWNGKSGTGVVISDEEDGRVLVACDPEPPEARHFVIQCTVTWLTEVSS